MRQFKAHKSLKQIDDMVHTFKQLKVVELASVLAGPSVGLFFAELGAKVIKVENKRTAGDVTRTWKLPSENKNDSISAYYSSVNVGKQSVFLDLGTAEDQTIVHALLEDADILIVNFKHGDAAKFNLQYEQLKQHYPHLIYAEITGFGEESDRVAYDLILQAETGYMSMNGTPESGPVKMPIAFIDLLAGHQLKEGVLLALYERDYLKKGGCLITVSLYEAALASLTNQATNWLMAGHIPQRIGSQHPNISPYGELFETKDGATITFAIGSDKQFQHLCEVLGKESLAEHHLFSTNSLRVANRVFLKTLLSEAVKEFDVAPLLEELMHKFVPAGRVKDMKEVFETPEAQALIVEGKIEGLTTKTVKSAVFKMIR